MTWFGQDAVSDLAKCIWLRMHSLKDEQPYFLGIHQRNKLRDVHWRVICDSEKLETT